MKIVSYLTATRIKNFSTNPTKTSVKEEREIETAPRKVSLSNSLQEETVIREKKVKKIKELVQSGKYKPDSREVASAILFGRAKEG
ncbi:MAG: hypothetical protein D6808_06445 [Candidatus Dadabacteria bacterium]|nr:MAG: hypothetical protein D6808_06445 [Candidatus Dadabacteria bacterium]